MKRQYVPIRNLKPGMRIDQAIVDRMDRVLVARGAILDEYVIQGIQKLKIPGIYIGDGQDETAPAKPEPPLTPLVRHNIEKARVDDPVKVQLSESVKKRVSEGVQYLYNNVDSPEFTDTSTQITSDLMKALDDNSALAVDISTLKTSDEYTFKHSVDVATMSMIIAKKQGMPRQDIYNIGIAGLLHDIGKAIDHEVEGPHAVIGADLARRYGERPEIVHAIEAHHADVDPDTVLDVLVQAADAISAARPGARRESAETYIKRLEKLEEISNSHDGVERTYAMQAGRELHVMVEPEKISDAQATVLAHDIAKQIEDEMEYPGQVRVVVIRESRAVDVAK